MNHTKTDRLTEIYSLAGVNYFNHELQILIKEIIADLYFQNCKSIFELRLNHIDRAILKYRQAKAKRPIWNTKQYFKACILSAIKESGFDEMEEIE